MEDYPEIEIKEIELTDAAPQTNEWIPFNSHLRLEALKLAYESCYKIYSFGKDLNDNTEESFSQVSVLADMNLKYLMDQ
jgi:hypothetical protein